MELIGLVKLGTPFLVLGMLAFLIRINEKMTAIRDDVRDIRRGMIWSDTCTARHDEINRRFGKLERHLTDNAV